VGRPSRLSKCESRCLPNSARATSLHLHTSEVASDSAFRFAINGRPHRASAAFSDTADRARVRPAANVSEHAAAAASAIAARLLARGTDGHYKEG
jgi:hypothetical protein